MKKVTLITLGLSAAVFALPLNWEMLVESAKADPRYEAAAKRAEATAKERNLKLWDKVEPQALGQGGTPLPDGRL